MYGLSQEAYTTFVTGMVFSVLATVTVIGRFAARRMNRARLGADDFWIILALLGMYAYFIVAQWGNFSIGGGQQASFANKNLKSFLKASFFLGPVYGFAISFCKFSIICLYRRVFTTPGFLRVSLVILILCAVWMVANVVAGFLYCIPIDSLWDPNVPSHCFDYSKWFLVMEIFNIFLTFAILCLPIRMIKVLHLPPWRKALVSGIFLMGGFVVITEIVRLALLYHASDQFVSVNVAFLWSEINLGTGVMCGCLPVYRPLVVKVAALSFTIRESVSSLLRSQRSDSTSKEQNFLSSERPSGYRDLGSSSAKSLKPQTSFAEHPIPLNAIEVKKGYEVV